MLQHSEQLELASKLLQLSIEEVEENCEVIEGSGALYVSIPIKGGDSLIVGQDGAVLYADSSVGYSRHLQEYERGTRTPVEAFDDVTQ